MFCSIIIPTVGRTSLSESVESVLNQNFTQGDFEIIVVNDSGQSLPPEPWQELSQVLIITTQKRERCFARNTGAAIAKGSYFCFLDDDDWLLPDALSHLWSLAQKHPNSAWLYGGVKFMDNKGENLGTLNQGKSGNCFVEVMTETWIPIQASLIKAEAFFEAGGFDPDYVGTEDLNLLRHIALNHQLTNTPEIVTCMRRGGARKTETEYDVGWYNIAKGRDNLLIKQNALPVLL
jgi:glycosyltransferase involved in cell wall biosynthesis